MLLLRKNNINIIFAISNKNNNKLFFSFLLIYFLLVLCRFLMSSAIYFCSLNSYVVLGDNYAKVLTKNIVLKMLKVYLLASYHLMRLRQQQVNCRYLNYSLRLVRNKR